MVWEQTNNPKGTSKMPSLNLNKPPRFPNEILAVAGGDEGGVEVEVAVLVEVCMYGHGHVVAYAQYGTEGVGAGAQVCLTE